MLKTRLGIVIVVAIGIAGLAAVEYQGRLREQNESLREQLARLGRLSTDNQRLSNLLDQARENQGSLNEQYQEVLRLRSQLNQQREESNRVDQAKLIQNVSEQLTELSALRSEVAGLSDEVNDLHDAILDLYAAGPASPATDKATDPSRNTDNPDVSIRMINTHDGFAEKLKRSAAAQDGEGFQEVFARFLQASGVEVRNVAGAVYDERTGRIIVRAPPATLDQIERLTIRLDGE